jgi:K+-transporting ATPase ATPase A chain
VLDAGRGRHRQPGRPRLQRSPLRLPRRGNNNGSAFAGLSANTPFYNTLLGLAMLLARYGVMIPVLAIAGSLAAKKIVPASVAPCPPIPRCSCSC